MSRSYFHLNVYIAWTSLQTWLWKDSYKKNPKSGISLCMLLGFFRPFWTTGDQPLCLVNLSESAYGTCSQRCITARKEAVDSACLPVNWAQQSHRIATCTGIAVQQLEREQRELPATNVETHEPWNKYPAQWQWSYWDQEDACAQTPETWEDRTWRHVSLIPTHLTRSF